MKHNNTLLACLIGFLFISGNTYAQINSAKPEIPFGFNTSYSYGNMPTNLPTSGTFKHAQDAADQYDYWIRQFVEACDDNTYRVKFDNTAQTVSEGIGYGMLLSAYAGDKIRFDGFWAFFKKSMNGNGLMNWIAEGCNGNATGNAATDADLDAAFALIIAAQQFNDAQYINDAKALISNIRLYEMDQSNKNTLNGDTWYNNNCLNPSYQSPAYYKEFALVDTENADFWQAAAEASSALLLKNRNETTGLVGNWCDANGTSNSCANTTPNEYGFDACRNPWRMTVDFLWNGENAEEASKSINGLLSNFIEGNEDALKGPMSQDASSPADGSYKNGAFSTFALSPMAADHTHQASLNQCYTEVANLSTDGYYFNETIKTISLFVLTGNFWKPSISSPTSFDNKGLIMKSTLYPNPCKEILHIQNKTNIASLTVIKGDGQMVLYIDNVNSTNYTLKVSELNKGVYLLKTHLTDGNETVSKFIK